MDEVMNRAARRAAGRKKEMVRVSNRISIVPMEHAETYLAHEIASEGKWASDVPLFIIQPEIDRGETDTGWFATTLERMRETRRRKGTLPVTIAMPSGSIIEMDVGLVDVTVFFEMPPDVLPLLPTSKDDLAHDARKRPPLRFSLCRCGARPDDPC